MAKETIFTEIKDLAQLSGISGRTRRSREWFRNKAREVGGSVSPRQLLRAKENLVARPRIGRMYMYFYDPKTKAKLPFYDRFPVIFYVAPAEGGFFGINMHYLPPKLRFILMTKLMTISTNKKFDKSTKLRLSYEILNNTQKFKEFRPTFKKYLNNHLRSKFLLIDPSDWEIAVFLPVESFRKAGNAKVWADSRRKI